ncbi:phage scaffolding protein [Lapidilactobacillus mulanensis]|uniref:Phage scaffolding protein n=1 Tax=Lapidilactobacillus mulanensis TaxID=2485999 RepID=A0ABW4DPC2_9LACO|nr:phage scaffolding protein [Lapidilactobacillus mulanensis]
MDTEELKGLGLSEEQVKGVMASYGKAVNPLKEQVTTLTSERDGFKTQFETVNGQLDTIKKGHKDDDDLKAQIEKLQADNKTAAETYQSDLTKTKVDYQTELALTQAGAKNVKAVKALLNSDKITLNDKGQLSGLDDQLEAVKKDNDFLFQGDTTGTAPQIVNPGNPNPDTKTKIDPATASYADIVAAQTAEQ